MNYPGSGTELSASVLSDGLTIIQNGDLVIIKSDNSTNLDDYEVPIKKVKVIFRRRLG